MRFVAALFLGVLAISGVATACSDSTIEAVPGSAGAAGEHPSTPGSAGTADAGEGGHGQGGHGGGEGGGDGSGRLSALMRRAVDCEDLTGVIHQRLQTLVADTVLVGTGGSSAWVLGVASGASGGTAGGTGTGGSSAGGSQGTGGSGQAPVCVRNGQTPWTQVNGSFPELAATDGDRLYLMQTRQGRIVDVQSADSLAELTPTELGRGDLGLFVLDGSTPETKTLVVLSTAFDDEVAVAAGRPYVDGCVEETFTKATVLRYAEAGVALDAEYFYQGHLVSAWSGPLGLRQLLATVPPLPAGLRITPTAAEAKRAEESMLERLAEQGTNPADLTPDELKLAFREAVAEVLAEVNAAVISEVRGEDWLPKLFVRRAGALEPLPVTCSDVYMPEAGTFGDGVTFVVSLEGPAGPAVSALLGSSPTIYQRNTTLVFGSPIDYQLSDYAPTYLHAFDVSGDEPFTYRGSGYVDARVTSPWSIDGEGDSLRVIGDQSSPAGSQGKLFVLGAENGALELLGESEPFPEAAGAARFVGDSVLVSVGLSLLTVDTSQPEMPRVVSESQGALITDLAQIIDDQHVLAIQQSDGFDFRLQLLDVSDSAMPRLVSAYDTQLGMNDLPLTSFHYEFGYHQDSGTLVMSFSGIQGLGAESFGTLRNWLDLYAVSPEAGIEPLGRLDGAHLEGLLTERTCEALPYDAARFDWSFLSNGTLLGVARQAVVAAPLADLQQRTTLLLPECGL